MKIIDTIDKEQFIKICNESLTMAQAAVKLNLHFNTFVRIAKTLECYKPNPGSKGAKKPWKNTDIMKILNGEYPEYQTNKLRLALIKYKIKPARCEICGLETWNNHQIPLELHHIDGDRFNHKLENLILICPNCHAQTETYRGKHSKKNLNGADSQTRTDTLNSEAF